jgi:hypothetical protein
MIDSYTYKLNYDAMIIGEKKPPIMAMKYVFLINGNEYENGFVVDQELPKDIDEAQTLIAKMTSDLMGSMRDELCLKATGKRWSDRFREIQENLAKELGITVEELETREESGSL